jgi:hypothetical protein
VQANPPAEKYARTEGVYREWTEACKGNGTPGSSFPGHSARLTEMVLLGNLAVRTREIIEWDSIKGRVSNVEEANRFIDEPYRKGWSLKG